jgi:AcrR family transcriptional regulator
LTTTRQGGHFAEMQRRRLILALTEILGENGLDGARVGRICTRAGVSRRTFYDLFTDREACFLAAFEFATERFARTVMPVYQREGRWHERIREALGLLLESFDREPLLAWLCIVETLKGDNRVLRRRGEAIDALVRAVDEGRSEMKGIPSPLTAESVVGGALAILHDRLLNGQIRSDGAPRDARDAPRVSCDVPRAVGEQCSLGELLAPLTSMIVQPYLGAAAAKRELQRRAPRRDAKATGKQSGAVGELDERPSVDPFRSLPIRFTYRTARVIDVIAGRPGASNRQVSDGSGTTDQGQISRLLHRLEHHELIVNNGGGHSKGEPNAWTLTLRGQAVHRALAGFAPEG